MARPPVPPDPAEPGARNIEEFRTRYDWVYERSSRVICPAADVAAHLCRYHPQGNYVIAPHAQLENVSFPPLRVRPLVANEPLVIAILGTIGTFKGADRLAACAREAGRVGAALQFQIIGSAEGAMPWWPKAPLRQTGPYRDGEVGALIEKVAPHVAWFTAQVPETFSYTLSEAFEAGLPVVAPALGAFPERVRGRPWSWIVDWRMPATEQTNFFLRLRKEHFIPGTPPIPPAQNEEVPAVKNFYAEDYLPDRVEATV